MKSKILMRSLVSAFVLMFISGVASATVIDLTSTGASGTINGAIFEQIDPQSTGTGVIDSFVQVSGAGNLDETHAYNTTVNNTFNNGSTDQFNHQIYLGEIPVVDIGGMDYLQFLLDVNENNNRALDQFISLDEVQIFVGDIANPSVTSFTGGILDLSTLVYQMDENEDSWVALNYDLNAGSGSGDMFMYVPQSNFAGYDADDAVILYSHFGGQGVDPSGFTGNFGTSDGFEEWAILRSEDWTDPIPEPSSLLLLGTGLAGLGFAVRRRKK